MSYSRNRKKKNNNCNNRINFIVAIVFLLVLICGFQLYKLQIREYDYFLALASSQHRVHSQLSPERGDIFIKSRSGGEENLYSMATNKDLALVFVIPKDVGQPFDLAEKLYVFFDQERTKKEVKELYIKQDQEELRRRLGRISLDLLEEERGVKVSDIRNNFDQERSSVEWKENREKEIKEEIEIRKGKIMDNYVEILSKENNPYHPFKRRVEKEDLLKMYDFLWPESREKKFNYEDLFVYNGRVYYDNNGTRVRVVLEGVSHTMEEHRYYPEGNIGAHFLGFVNPFEIPKKGNYGLEGFFDRELSGKLGFIDSSSREDEESVMINGKRYKKAEDGSDLILSIDRSIQFQVCRELESSLRTYGAKGGSVIVVSPDSGAIIAMCSYPSFDPNLYNQVSDINVYNNPAIFEDYEPGSVFKTITMAAALNEEAITPYTTYEDKGKIEIDKWTIRNSDYSTRGAYGVVDMNYALTFSLNTGSVFAMEKIGINTFTDYVQKFGFGSRTGIELAGESSGDIRNLQGENISRIYGATASYGQGITVTPLQLVMAYAAIANKGVLMKPYVVEEIIYNNGETKKIEPVELGQIISERAAALLSGMLVNVVEEGHAKGAGVEGYYVGGKTGTAQVASIGGYGAETIHTFVGIAPIENPKFTMLVRLDDPKNVRFSASSAAPLFGKMADFILNYYQVSKER